MNQPTKQRLLEVLQGVRYPGTNEDIVSSGMVGDDINIEGNKISFSILFKKQHDPFAKSLIKMTEQTVLLHLGKDIDIVGNIQAVYPEATEKKEEQLLPNVKNIIAIASGKGGVGKSTVSTNLAVALANQGYKVGLLDADIFGPSIPKMFDLEETAPEIKNINGKDLIVPEEKYGVKTLSIGFFVKKENAIIWRGSMAGNALRQLISDADWGDLDYFFIDLPPGTSDIHLTLVQTLPLTGAVIVTTPQEVSLADARKGINMFDTDKVNVPILGVVENMSYFTPKELPENKYYIFGKGGGEKLAKEFDIPLLAKIPIVADVCESGDAGHPIVDRDNPLLENIFSDLATSVVEQTNKRNNDLPPTSIVEVNKR